MAQAFKRVLAVAFGKKNVGSIPTPGLFLYLAPAVEPVLAVAFGKKMLVRFPLQAYFFI